MELQSNKQGKHVAIFKNICTVFFIKAKIGGLDAVVPILNIAHMFSFSKGESK